MKKLSFFLSGMLTMLALTALTVTTLAASGKVLYNRAGISLFGQEEVQAGENLTAPNGQQIPSVITYVDSAGSQSHYLAVQEISRLLDAEIAWNPDTNTIDIAPVNESELIVIREGQQAELPSEPVYGAIAGPFTEIDPQTVDTSGQPLIQMMNHHMISNAGYSGFGLFRASGGNHILFTITNNGETEQVVRISRPITVSNRSGEAFPDVKLSPGQTMTRAFCLEEGAGFLTSRLRFDVDSASGAGLSDITMSLMQYQ